jgi:hypothetical protein
LFGRELQGFKISLGISVETNCFSRCHAKRIGTEEKKRRGVYIEQKGSIKLGKELTSFREM